MYVRKGDSASDVAEAWDNFQREFRGFDSQADMLSQVETGASGSKSGGSSSSEWVWWSSEGIWHRQEHGVDQWRAPTSTADSGWTYSTKMKAYFVKHANGAVTWQS